MSENRINGNTEGIRQSALERLRELYDMEIDGDCFAPRELIDRIAAFSGQCNREVSVYISRDGRVMDITVGRPESVPLKSLRLRRNPGRLSMIRCIHTHPEGEARLS
ncbi:MAG TPA: GTPase HflX, partial [Candidatus Fimadaptatus faecigallinarum]|nr:GTPase HflX [Candidatus Fimadaptatus faecigallinarum]